MEAKNNEPALSLLESGRESTFSYQADREQLEELRNKVRILESENTDLKRVQPRLIDAHGKDVTKEFSKLARELQNSKNICEELDDERRKLLKSRTELEQSAIMQIDQKDKELSEMKRKAMELEEENLKLREQIHDEQSRIHRLQGADNGNGGDGNFEYYLSKLNQKSISTTLQSFAGLGITQQTDQSIAEHANATIDSMNAMNLAGRTANLAEVCIQMFEKLRGTAEFFQELLGKLNIGVDEVGEDLMRKIVSMKLDLDKSMSEARVIVNEAKNAEQNMRLFLEQSSQIAMNSTAFEEPVTADAEVKTCEKCKELEMKTCEKCKELEMKVCEKCTELQEFYETAKSALDGELERQKLLEEQIEHLLQKVEEFEAIKEQLELSNKKCDELQQLFDSVKSELNTQLSEKKTLLEKIAELEQKSSKLEEEKEQISSSIKENQMIPRAQLVEGIRGELGKIYDTMSFASSRLKKKPVQQEKKNEQ